jgi:lipopolysaccharide transport system permease protein
MTTSPPEIVVDPPRRWPGIDFRHLWAHRELLFFLIWRNVKVRYRQTFVGVGWSVFQPLASVLVFTFLFKRVANIDTGPIPYPLFVLAGFLPWQYFSSAVSISALSLVTNVVLVSKVYFPRILLPVSTILTALFDFLISMSLLIVLMIWYTTPLRWSMLLLPVLVIALILTAASISIWLAALNVRYRDIGFVVPFLMQLWLFLTPVVYPGTAVAEGPLRILYSINPMVGIVEAFRWMLVGGNLDTSFLWVSGTAVLVSLVSGWFYFNRTEQSFADVI